MTQRAAVIVGAGIGGPVLGVWLRRLGYRVTIAEARSETALGEGAFLGLAPNGLRVLAELGVLQGGRLPFGQRCDAFEFRNAHDARIGEIDRRADEQRFGHSLTMVRRADVHRLLTAQAVAAGVTVRFGLTLHQLDQTDPRVVTARFHDGSTLDADVLLGCDGLRSTTRTLSWPAAPPPRFSGLLDAGGFVSMPGLDLKPGVSVMVFGRRAFFGAFKTAADEVWWFHNGPPAKTQLRGEAFRAHLLELHRNDPSWVSEVIRATPEILGPWPLHEVKGLRSWVDRRVAILGDAAHAMSPSAGQGASLAMEDAMVLAQCLRDVEGVPRALRRYEALRRPRVEPIARHAARQGNNKAPSAIGGWVRDRLLPVFLKAGGAAQDATYAYRIDWSTRVTSTPESNSRCTGAETVRAP